MFIAAIINTVIREEEGEVFNPETGEWEREVI